MIFLGWLLMAISDFFGLLLMVILFMAINDFVLVVINGYSINGY
jgi:hypothetical protein